MGKILEQFREAASWSATQVRVIFPDVNGAPCGKIVPVNKFLTACESGFRFSRSVLAQDIEGENSDVPGFTAEEGDPDLIGFPLPETFVMLPWEKGTGQVLLNLIDPATGEPFVEYSRAVLQRAIAKYEAQGILISAAIELEFYLTAPEGRLAETGHHAYHIEHLIRFGPVIEELLASTKAIGLNVEAAHHEYAPGQLEINFAPLDPLTMADRTFLFKQMVREVARKHGYGANFLAKPFAEHSGSGAHVHISLWRGGRNIFWSENAKGGELTPDLRRFLNGQVVRTRDFFALYLPNPNSYRRYAVGSYVPTIPTWREETRDAAFRLLRGSESATRVEHRIAGADANPYLLLAGILHAGLPNAERTDAESAEEEAEGPPFPESLPESLRAFEQSDFARERLTPEFVRLFAAVKRQENQKFQKVITDWEREVYGPSV